MIVCPQHTIKLSVPFQFSKIEPFNSCTFHCGILKIFDEAGMERLVLKRNHLTSYLEWLLEINCGDSVRIQTPGYIEGKECRGAMLSIRVKGDAQKLVEVFKEQHVLVDFRTPDILRI